MFHYYYLKIVYRFLTDDKKGLNNVYGLNNELKKNITYNV